MGSNQSHAWDEDRRYFIDDFNEKTRNPKIVKFKAFSFPVEDPVDMKVMDEENKKEIQLKCYRYPHANKKHRPKGIVFYVHGFSDYSARFAHIGRKFSEFGFDFFSQDQRGHGKSQGKTVYIPSIDQITQDTIKFHRMVIEKFYPNENRPDIYIVAHSMGCM